jgi:hypothetical protein
MKFLKNTYPKTMKRSVVEVCQAVIILSVCDIHQLYYTYDCSDLFFIFFFSFLVLYHLSLASSLIYFSIKINIHLCTKFHI